MSPMFKILRAKKAEDSLIAVLDVLRSSQNVPVLEHGSVFAQSVAVALLTGRIIVCDKNCVETLQLAH